MFYDTAAQTKTDTTAAQTKQNSHKIVAEAITPHKPIQYNKLLTSSKMVRKSMRKSIRIVCVK